VNLTILPQIPAQDLRSHQPHRLCVTATHTSGERALYIGLLLTSTRVVLGTFFGLYIFLILVTVLEIILYAFSYLQSGLYLFFQILKTASSVCIWTVLFFYPFVVLDSSRQPVEASVFMATICVFLQ